MRRSALVLAILFAAALLVGGCGRSRKTVISGPGGKVTVRSEKSSKGEERTTTVETKEGKATVTGGTEKEITEAELGVPVYPGAKVYMETKMETKTASAGGSGEQHILFTPDAYDRVVEFYKKNLKNVKGEHIASSGDQKLTIFTVGEGKDLMMVHLHWDSKENRTMINVMKAGKHAGAP